MSVTPPENVWSQVSRALRAELGEGAFNSYVEPACVRQGPLGDLFLVTPTAYARDWLKRNAMRRINELWLAHDALRRRLEARARAEYEAENPEAAADGAGRPPAPLAAVAAAAAPMRPTVGPVTDGPRAVRAAGLQERLTFDTFVPGQGNEFAVAVARQIASWADGHFNPVFFCGPYGYGKTHLLNAIAWEAQRLRPDARVIYLTAERFLSTFVRAIQDKSTGAFKDELRGADLLLIDDVHFIGGKSSTQEELFHTLTALLEEGRRVVLSGDRPPTALSEVEPRLRSHLAAGLTCPVEAADRNLKLAVLQKKLEGLGRMGLVEGPAAPEVLMHLVDRTPGSIRELEGALNTLAAVAGQRLTRLGPDEAAALLSTSFRAGERRITVDEIQKTTADHFGLKQADLLSERRTRAVARPRQVAMYLCKQLTTRSYPDIGRRFGGRDHTTVLHGVRRIEALIPQDEQIARDVEALIRKLRG